MSGPYDINPKIPQEPDKIWAAVRKQLPRADQGEFLFRPRYIYSGKKANVRIAYPGFLTWLKFVDPDGSRAGQLRRAPELLSG